MKTLVVIPARGGSRGIPGKNIKPLAGKPLLHYSLELAGSLPGKPTICVSTDDEAIAQSAATAGYPVPFLRPKNLATDTAGTYEVLLHALEYYEQQRQQLFDTLLLLQPTSPLRKPAQVIAAMDLFAKLRPEMVVSVHLSSANPYYNLFEETEEGRLVKSKPAAFVRRQDCPPVYQYNGAIYVISVDALRTKPLHKMSDVGKYLMDEQSTLDLDSELDWKLAEVLLQSSTEE